MRDIKNLKPNKNGRFQQDYYIPKYPNKYLGDPTKIIYRSSWERKFCYFCDMNSSIIQWSSERIAVPYISPLDVIRENLKPDSEKTFKDPPYRNYYVDFTIKVKSNEGRINTWLVEIKPMNQTKMPNQISGNYTLKKMTNFNKDMVVYLVNAAKFKAANAYAKARGAQFGVLTEDKNGNFNVS